MQILYGFSNCTDTTYEQIAGENNVAVLRPDQKYHGLLIRGLAENGAEVRCLSGLPINRSVTKKVWISYPDETEGRAHYHYYKTLNVPVLRQLMIFCGAFFNTLRVKKTGATYAVCDCLNIANAYGMALAARLRGIPLVTVVTDLPDMMGGGLTRRINNRFFSLADGFILLTEPMNARLNPKNKPYLVLEGHADADSPAPEPEASYEAASGKKVVLYAGSLLKLYGIRSLVEGFLRAAVPDSELHIYGDGDYREELCALAAAQENIRYYGVRPNAEILEDERRAALLVNPRPTAPEYTKYSFPSKNMEYMVSGTPVLTTVLPGMPREYYPYVYLLTEESPDGVACALREILSLPREQRVKRGLAAREFVLSEKSNVKQSARILEFLKERCNRV